MLEDLDEFECIKAFDESEKHKHEFLRKSRKDAQKNNAQGTY
jgi:hypothetical protein